MRARNFKELDISAHKIFLHIRQLTQQPDSCGGLIKRPIKAHIGQLAAGSQSHRGPSKCLVRARHFRQFPCYPPPPRPPARCKWSSRPAKWAAPVSVVGVAWLGYLLSLRWVGCGGNTSTRRSPSERLQRRRGIITSVIRFARRPSSRRAIRFPRRTPSGRALRSPRRTPTSFLQAISPCCAGTV